MNYQTITKNHNYKGENYHEVVVKSAQAHNTGPKQVFASNYTVKWGMVDKWIENSSHEVVKVFNHVYKS